MTEARLVVWPVAWVRLGGCASAVMAIGVVRAAAVRTRTGALTDLPESRRSA